MTDGAHESACSGDLEAGLSGCIREVVQLRMGAKLPGPHSSPETMLDCLLDVRQRLDRVEELLGNVMRLRTAAHKSHTAARVQVEDAWDEAAVRLRNAGVRDEYSSARERTAAANLEVIDARRLERSTGEVARRCDEAVEFIKLRHRGLTDIRLDLLAILRAQQFETTLDR